MSQIISYIPPSKRNPIGTCNKKYSQCNRIKISSCTGWLEIGDYYVSVVQLLKCFNILKNTFLNDLMDNMILVSKDDTNNLFYGQIMLPSSITLTPKKQQIKKDYLKLKQYEKICKITKINYKYIDGLISVDYEDKIDKEIAKYPEFTFIGSDYKIVPSQPFHNIFSEQLEFVMGTEQMTDFLQNITFQYYSTYLTIDDLFKIEKIIIIDKLKQIIKNIENFYTDKFKYQIQSKYQINITLNKPKKNRSNQVIFYFTIIEPKFGYSYISITDTFRKPNIYDIISRIENNSFYYFDSLLNPTEDDDCIDSKGVLILDNIVKTPKRIDNSSGTYQTLFGTDRTIIKIISNSDVPNKFHTYCSTFYLIVVGEKYFKLSIKIITYDKIKSDVDFACKFITLLSPKLKQLQPDVKYVEADTLANLEIFVKEIDPSTYKIPINIYYDETPLMYNGLLIKIKSANISEPLILTLLWFRELQRIHFQYYSDQDIHKIQKAYLLDMIEEVDHSYKKQFRDFTQNLIRITTYACFIFSEFKITKDFIRINKYSHNYGPRLSEILSLILSDMMCVSKQQEIDKKTLTDFIDYINSESGRVIWYIPPKLTVINYTKLNKYLESISGERDIYSISDRDKFKTFTNFYELYEQSDFIHNIRHIINKDQVTDILSLLNKGEVWFAGFHYPNKMYYQVFHTQIITSNKFDSNSYVDKQHGFHNIFSRRFTSIMFLKQQLVSEQTMLLSQTFTFPLSDCLVDDKLKVNKQELKQELKTDYSSTQFLSDEDIEDILRQNNIV